MEQMQSTEKMFLDENNFVKVKKSRFWIGVIVIIVVIFLVGILSGVLSAKSERDKVEAEYAGSKAKRDKGRFLERCYVERNRTKHLEETLFL